MDRGRLKWAEWPAASIISDRCGAPLITYLSLAQFLGLVDTTSEAADLLLRLPRAASLCTTYHMGYSSLITFPSFWKADVRKMNQKSSPGPSDWPQSLTSENGVWMGRYAGSQSWNYPTIHLSHIYIYIYNIRWSIIYQRFYRTLKMRMISCM